MKPIDENLIEYKSGGGFACLFGLPFLLGGLFAISQIFIPGQIREGDTGTMAAAILFGSIFSMIGGGIVFYRSKISIDKNSRSIEKRWSLLVLGKVEQLAFEDFDKVEVTREVRRSKDSTYTVYPVKLDGRQANIKIKESRIYSTARQLSETLSDYMSLDVHDSSTGETTIREAGSMNLSLREQAQAKGERVQLEAAPAHMLSTLNMDGDDTLITIPPKGLKGSLLLMLLPFLFFEAVVFGMFLIPMLSSNSPMTGKAVPIVFISVFFVLIPIVVFLSLLAKNVLGQTTIRISFNRLLLTQGFGPYKKNKILNADDIEELMIHNAASKTTSKQMKGFGFGNGIIIRTDKESINIGGHLPDEEKAYMHSLIKSMLVA